MDSYTTVDLRTGLEMGHWSFELYGKNLGDKQGITDFIPSGQFPAGPRTRRDPAAHNRLSIGARF